MHLVFFLIVKKIVASCPALQVTSVSECGLCWWTFKFYRTVFLVFFSLDSVFYFLCVLCIFLSTSAVLEPFSQIKKSIPVLVFRRLFYIYVSYFYIFFYGYLLHIVVYITVVWIDTIIYFSMKNNLKTHKNKSQNVVLGVEVIRKMKEKKCIL